MSLGPLGGITAAAAGSPLAQTRAGEAERSQQADASQQRQVKSEIKAEAAAGIAQTDGEDHATDERDADGRRLWEEPPGGEHPPDDQSAASAATADVEDAEQPRSRDPSGESGSHLDLTG